MADVRSKIIDVDATVAGQEFNLTELEINRGISSAGEMILRGFGEDPSEFALDDFAQARIKQINSDDNSVQTNQIAFRGQIKKVNKNREGKVSVFAYDQLANLYRKRVRLNIEEPTPAYKIARAIIRDSEFDLVETQASVEKFTEKFFVEDGKEFPGGITRVKPTYGSAQSGDKLYYVLNDLASKMSGVLWADRQNNVRIEPYPFGNVEGRLEEIIEFGEGEEDIGEKKVTVKGRSPTGDLGSGAFSLYNTASTSKSATSARAGQEDEPPEKTINDDGIVTEKGAEKRAQSDRFRNEVSVNAAEVTVSGNAAFELYDRAILPDEFISDPDGLTAFEATLGRGDQSNPNRVSQNQKFTINGIQHTVSASDGYETTITLSPDAQAIFRGIDGVADRIRDEALANVEDRSGSGGFLYD